MIAKVAGLIALVALTFGSNVRSEVVKEMDHSKSCTRYKRINHVRNSNGDYVLEREVKPTEEVVSKKDIYGFGLKDLEIDFDNREVSLNIDQKIIMGFNRNLTKKKVKLAAEHPRFKEIINELNYDVLLLDEVCINSSGELIDVVRLEK